MIIISGAVSWTDPGAERSMANRMRHAVTPFGRPQERDLVSLDSACLEATRGGVESGDPPAIFSSPDLIVVADARIDNVDELRSRLGCGPDASGAALLAAGYRRWGGDLPVHICGDFALAIWDSRRRVMLLARDPFGVRPLLFSRSSSHVLVASLEEPLLALTETSRALDSDAVLEYLTWAYRGRPRTFFRDIHKVPPGHVLTFSQSEERSVRYWCPPSSEIVLPTTEDYHREFRRLFSRSVRARLGASSPVLAHISGGMDSSTILCVADEMWRAGERPCPDLRGVGAIHPGLDCDESAYIQAVAEHVEIPIECWDGTGAASLDLESPGVSGPGSRTAMTGGTQGDIEIAGREGAGVILSGNGGDHLGCTVGVFEDMVARGRWRDAWRVASRGTSSSARRGRVRQLAAAFAPHLMKAGGRLLRGEQAVAVWLTAWAASRLRGVAGTNDDSQAFFSHVERGHWSELTSPRLLASIDILQTHAVRHGIEIRFPFLDRDLVTFVLAVPVQHWPGPWKFERFHREAYRQTLPPRISARRSKADFTTSLVERVGNARRQIRDILWDSRWESESYVDRAAARRLFERLERGVGPPVFSDWYGLWSVATVEVWIRKLMGYSHAPKED